MSTDEREDAPPGRRRAAPRHQSGLPVPVVGVVVIVLLAYLGYALIVLQEDGLPFAWIIGGLLGGTLGIDQFLKNRGGPPGGGTP